MKRLLVLILASTLFSGCSGITAYQYTNHREEGPHNGLFSGSQGAFEITLPAISR